MDLGDARHGDALVALLDEYARDPAGGGKALSDAVKGSLVAALATQSHYLGLLAYRGAEAVGLANAFLGFSTFAARPLLNVHDVVVRREVRRRGVGRRLMAELESIARARGCCKMTLEVLAENRPARAAYEAGGFRAYALDPAFGVALFMEKALHAD